MGILIKLSSVNLSIRILRIDFLNACCSPETRRVEKQKKSSSRKENMHTCRFFVPFYKNSLLEIILWLKSKSNNMEKLLCEYSTLSLYIWPTCTRTRINNANHISQHLANVLCEKSSANNENLNDRVRETFLEVSSEKEKTVF